jgi:caa(3)-type oxidase subunit IV
VVGIVGFLAQESGTAAHTVAGTADWFAQHAWLIPLLPFASAALTLFFGKRTPGKGPVYGIVAVGVAFVLAIGVLLNFAHGGGTYEHNVNWFTVGPLQLQLGIYIDGLAGAMLVVVTAIEIAVSYTEGDIPDALIIVLLLGMAVVKFSLVAAWYMHLRTDLPIFRRFFVLGIAAAIVLYVVVLATLHALTD